VRAIFTFVLLFAALGALGYAIVKESRDPRFALESVAITGDLHTGEAQLTAASGFRRGENVWLLDTGGAARRIEALPWVATVTIARAWPNHVSISIEERTPEAAVRLVAGGGAEEPFARAALVDAGMRVLAIVPADSTGGLPVLEIDPAPSGLRPGADATGTDVEHAYDALVQLRALGLPATRVELAPATGITVVTTGGLQAILGSVDDLAKKVTLFKAIAQQISHPNDVAYVDVRSVRAPTVQYR
jgi:cell division protein FtsQ